MRTRLPDDQYVYHPYLLEYREYFRIDSFCTPEEVDRIENDLGIRFPASYRELYLLLGASRAFRIGPENSFLFPNYAGMFAVAKSIAKAGQFAVDIGGNDFVFCCFDETGFFWFFKLDEGDDPPVYQYEEYDDNYIRVADSLTAFIQGMDRHQTFLRMKAQYPRLGE